MGVPALILIGHGGLRPEFEQHQSTTTTDMTNNPLVMSTNLTPTTNSDLINTEICQPMRPARPLIIPDPKGHGEDDCAVPETMKAKGML